MSRENNSINRRSVLRSVAAGSTGLALGSTSVSATADSSTELLTDQLALGEDPIEVLKRKAVLGDPEVADIPADVINGKRLLTALSNDGVIASPSFDVLPDQAYEFRAHGHTEIGIKQETDRGVLQIKFSPISPPYAILRGEQSTVHYAYTDEGVYETIDTSASQDEPNSERDIGSPDCGGCDGCHCRPSPFCIPFGCGDILICDDCHDGDCWTTDKCCC